MSKIVNSDNLLQFGQEFLENLDERYLAEIDDKQDVLVSGTNIKTINNQSVLGSGNIEITSGTQSDWNETNISDPAYIKNKPTIQTINTVNVSVDNDTGTPSATGSVSGTTLSLNFHNLKGQQGNTGSSVDYPYELVNNLTTDDATKGLSAAQGVVLDNKVSQLRSEISDVAYNQDNVQYVVGKWKNNNGVVDTGTSSTLFRFNPIPIIHGNQFTYTTLRSGVSGPSLIIADSYDNVLVESDEFNGTMLAPEHAAKLYFNSTKAGFSCTISGILNSFPRLEKTVSKLSGIDSLMAKGAGSESFIYLDEFERGNINGNNGQPVSSTKCIRTTDYIAIIQRSALTYSLNTGFSLGLAFYEYDGTFIIKREWLSGSGSEVVPTNSYFLKVVINHPSSDITPDDLSDAGLVLRTDHVAENVPCASLENVKMLESLIGEFGVYPSNAQKPADGSSDSDFDAENITPQELYDAFDGLAGKICPPNSAIYPKYITEYYKEGDDATETYKIKAYVLTKRDRFAWLHADKLYAWKNGNTVVYIDSCSPRIGDTIYSDDQRTDSGMTVASYDSSTQSFTSSSSSVFTRSNTDNVAADILFSKELKSSGSLALFNRSDASAGTATLTDQTHLTVSGKNYVRCDSFDYHTATKGTIVLWANEHGAQSDPYEGSITMYNLARDLTLGGFRNNEFLLFLKDYIKVVIIPCANPYSMYMYATTKREGRFNANGVNLNRNYDTPGWAVYSGEPKGNYAGDQNETQFVMNTCLAVEAALGIDVHCLSYTTEANQGKCHHSGRIPNSTVNSKVRIAMQNYGLEYSNYGDADPETGGAGKDWLLFNGIVGGLIEMNAGPYASAFNGKQHSSFFLEADYTLLLNAIKMWWYGINPKQFIY